MLSGNENNYDIARDAVRGLQNDLNERHPYLYGGSEVLGATMASRFTKPIVAPVIAGVGYADEKDDVLTNIGKNMLVSRFTNGIQKLPKLPQDVKNFGQNLASWKILSKEEEEEERKKKRRLKY